MISPFYMLIILPVMFLQIPGIEFTIPMACIPVVNVCMVFREAVMGEYQWPQIALTVAVELGSVGLCLWIAATILQYEDVLTGTFDGNMMKFLKERVLTRRAPTGGSR